MTIQDVLKYWLQYAEYDPDQKSFNLLSTNYHMHKICDQIKALMPFDPTCIFGVLYAKQEFKAMMMECKVKAWDCISSPGYLDEEQQMWSIFCSDMVAKAEQALLDEFDALVQNVVPAKQLGSRDQGKEREALSHAIAAIANDLPKCNVDLFRRGGNFQKITNYSTSVHVFPSLANCLLTIEQAQDGIYLCYILYAIPGESTHGGAPCASADSYFTFIIKSNGNILSVNERVDEHFPGQHGNQRNARWTEGKKDFLFPYGFIFSYADYDYKGYATTEIIDEEKLAFFQMEPKAYLPLIFAMLMLNVRFAGTDPNEIPRSLVDSLLPLNLSSPAPEMQALVVPKDSSLAITHQEYHVPFTVQQLMSNTYSDKFIDPPEKNPYTRGYMETGTFRRSNSPEPTLNDFYNNCQDAPLFIKLYADGFDIDVQQLLESNRHLKLLAASDSSEKRVPNPEYIGSPRRMELLAYKNGRDQLAEYIRKQHRKEYAAFGGRDAVISWYRKMLTANKERIYSMCAKASIELNAGKSCKKDHGLQFASTEKYAAGTYEWRGTLNGRVMGGKDWDLECPVTGTKATERFRIEVNDWHGLATLFGMEPEELPKVLQGYRCGGHRVYGNSILDVTDAVSGVGTIFERWEAEKTIVNERSEVRQRTYLTTTVYQITEEYSETKSPVLCFDLVVGFSKRGLKKLCKEI